MSNSYAYYNPYAPPAYNGLTSNPGQIELAYDYIFNIVLTASANLPNQSVNISTEADFALRALVLASNTGAFLWRITDAQGYQLSNNYLSSSMLLTNGVPSPYVIMPQVIFPAGGRITIDLIDTSAATNTIQMAFRGCKLLSCS